LRLTEIGYKAGLISKKRYQCFLKKKKAVENGDQISAEVSEQIDIIKKYSGYIRRQQRQVEKFKRLEHRKIPQNMHFEKLHGVSKEARHKLAKLKPVSIGQASRIAGISPADIAVLLIHLETYRRKVVK